MGAQSFILSAYAPTARQAYESLVEDARYEYGHDHYNGTISTCSLGRITESFVTYSEANERKMKRIIRDVYDYGHKWQADCIDLGVYEYEVHTVKKTNPKYTARYRQKFCVFAEGKRKGFFDTKGEADKKALELILKQQLEDVVVRKTMIDIDSGNDIVSSFCIDVKKYKKKPKLKSLENRTVIPIHKYIFYGWAAE